MSKKSSTVAYQLGLVALAVLGSPAAMADDPLGWYLGANIGRTRADFDSPYSIGSVVAPGVVVNSISQSTRDTGFKAFGGYQFHRNFAVEGGIFDLGTYNYAYNTTPPGSFNSETRVKGLNLDLVGILPISDRFSVFGRVGAAHARTRGGFTSTGAAPVSTANFRANHTNLKAGIGLAYAFTERLSVRAELERYRINDPIRNRGHIDMASVGLVYRFGEKPRPPVVQTYVPPPVVAAPPPPPPRVVVIPPPPPPAPPPPAPVYVPPERPAKQGRN